MKSNSQSFDSLKWLVGLACFVIIIAGFKAAGTIIVQFLLSIFIATICAPMLFWLQQRKIPTPAAILIIMFTIVVIALLFTTFAGNSISEFTKRLPFYQTQLKDVLVNYLHWFDKVGIKLSSDALFEYFDPGFAMKLAANTLTRLRAILTDMVFIFLTVIFILMELAGFSSKLTAAFGFSEDDLNRVDLISTNIIRYLAIKSLTSLTTGIFITIMLFIIGVDFPMLWGVTAFLLNYIPAIGSIIAAIPAVLLAMVQLGTGGFLLTGASYLAVNMVIGNFIEPRLFGREVGLSTLVVFLSLVFWGWVFGPIGMFLSVPLTMIIKIALETSDETRWLAILLGPDPKEKTA